MSPAKKRTAAQNRRYYLNRLKKLDEGYTRSQARGHPPKNQPTITAVRQRAERTGLSESAVLRWFKTEGARGTSAFESAGAGGIGIDSNSDRDLMQFVRASATLGRWFSSIIGTRGSGRGIVLPEVSAAAFLESMAGRTDLKAYIEELAPPTYAVDPTPVVRVHIFAKDHR